MKRLSPFLIGWAANQWRAGASAKQIACEIGVTTPTVYGLVRREAWPRRPRGGGKRRRPARPVRRSLSPEMMVMFYESGCTLEEIGQAAGVTRERVRQLVTPLRTKEVPCAHRPLAVLRCHAAGMTHADAIRETGLQGQALNRVSKALGLDWQANRAAQHEAAREARRVTLRTALRDLYAELGRGPTLQELAERYEGRSVVRNYAGPLLSNAWHGRGVNRGMEAVYREVGVPFGEVRRDNLRARVAAAAAARSQQAAERQARAVTMRSEGKSVQTIAETMGVGRQSVYRYLRATR